MKSFEVINLLKNYFNSKGVRELKPCGLISSAFPNTFNPSAVHDVVRKIVNTRHVLKSVKQHWAVERCIRQVDIPRLGDGIHICLFEMIASVVESQTHLIPREKVINQSLQLISSCLQVAKDRLVVTCFGGADIGGRTFEPDSVSPNIWRKLGIKTILSVPGRSNFTYLESEGEAAGPRCEIYYQLENPARQMFFIEIGSIIFETHRFHRGRPVETRNVASGFAFGLERLLMVINRANTIYDSDVFKPLIDLVIGLLSDKKYGDVFNDKMLVTIDVLKALYFILAESPTSLSNQQKNLLLRLLRIARDGCITLQLSFDTMLPRFADQLAQIYEHRLSYLKINSENIVRMLNSLLTSPNNKTLELVLNGNKHRG